MKSKKIYDSRLLFCSNFGGKYSLTCREVN